MFALGGGQNGEKATLELRRLGFLTTTVVIDKSPFFGDAAEDPAITCGRADVTKLAEVTAVTGDAKFDVVFCIFSVLGCVDEWAETIAAVAKSDAIVILVTPIAWDLPKLARLRKALEAKDFTTVGSRISACIRDSGGDFPYTTYALVGPGLKKFEILMGKD